MPRFEVEIVYEPLDGPPMEGEERLYDPPQDRDNPRDRNRVYKTVVSARSSREAIKKAVTRMSLSYLRRYGWEGNSDGSVLHSGINLPYFRLSHSHFVRRRA